MGLLAFCTSLKKFVNLAASTTGALMVSLDTLLYGEDKVNDCLRVAPRGGIPVLGTIAGGTVNIVAGSATLMRIFIGTAGDAASTLAIYNHADATIDGASEKVTTVSAAARTHIDIDAHCPLGITIVPTDAGGTLEYTVIYL